MPDAVHVHRVHRDVGVRARRVVEEAHRAYDSRTTGSPCAHTGLAFESPTSKLARGHVEGRQGGVAHEIVIFHAARELITVDEEASKGEKQRRAVGAIFTSLLL